jgi:hypothetical protein
MACRILIGIVLLFKFEILKFILVSAASIQKRHNATFVTLSMIVYSISVILLKVGQLQWADLIIYAFYCLSICLSQQA